ncbi:MAG: hypothetical protein AB7D51_13990 [Desulfovibrionaceae bacterium]|jgi:hypothetical protein
MAQHTSFLDALTFEEQIKALADDELLDFWEETQQLAGLVSDDSVSRETPYNPEYERLILIELQMRAGRRVATGR